MAKMENIRLSRDGDDLIIRVNMGHDSTISGSGSSVLVATTHSFKTIWIEGEETDLEMNMNIRRSFCADEPKSVEVGWIPRQDRK